MKIIILGAGQVGGTLAENLVGENNEITLVDTDIERLRELQDKYDLRVVTGPAAGREVALVKVVTTLGKPGVAVASITRRHQGYVLAHVEGSGFPHLNGSPVDGEPVALKSGDRIALAGTEMEFVLG